MPLLFPRKLISLHTDCWLRRLARSTVLLASTLSEASRIVRTQDRWWRVSSASYLECGVGWWCRSTWVHRYCLFADLRHVNRELPRQSPICPCCTMHSVGFVCMTKLEACLSRSRNTSHTWCEVTAGTAHGLELRRRAFCARCVGILTSHFDSSSSRTRRLRRRTSLPAMCHGRWSVVSSSWYVRDTFEQVNLSLVGSL